MHPRTGAAALGAVRAAADLPARVIVKLRPDSVHRSLAATPTPGTTFDATTAPGVDPALAALMTRHGVRSAARLAANPSRTGPLSSTPPGTSATSASTGSAAFPARAARAPAGATAPDFSATFVLDLGVRPAADLAATLQAMRREPGVVYAEEDRTRHTLYTPNDPSYGSVGSWGQPYDDLHGLKAIDAGTAWDTTQGQGIVVAVIDTGVDYEHPDIQANIWLNPREIAGNAIDDDANGFVDDVLGWDFVGASAGVGTEDADPTDIHGHGTHVSGTIAATGDDGLGVIGVAWKAQIMPVKGLDDYGSGFDSQLARAILYAVDNGADVINASWGAPGVSQTLADAVNYARAHGVVFVAAAGNETKDASRFSPACIPAAITVAALDPYGRAAYFSNFGTRIDVAAPGEDILSLEARTAGYTRKSGTSMAAPHVSGVAALILASHPTFSPEQVRQVLRTTATDLGDAGKDTAFGYGRIHAAAATVTSGDVLESRILDPFEHTPIAGPIALTGSAAGVGFLRYELHFGAGFAPETWTLLNESSTAVTNSELGRFDPSTLADGFYTVRLRATTTSGATYSDQVAIEVRYLALTSPLPPPVPSLTQQMKPGGTYPITGSARGPSFQSYTLEWAPGAAATSGWSAEGMALVDSGQHPVEDGPLATWTLPVGLHGHHTIRLTVNNDGFSSSKTSSIYAEPSLVSSGWPVLVGGIPDDLGPTLVRQPDGTTRFVYLDRQTGALYSLSYDGSRETRMLGVSFRFEPTAADLDGVPGDEIVVPNGYSLEILGPDLTPIRSILTPRGRYFAYDQITLADLDGDGCVEILAPSRSNEASMSSPGMLHIYRADGTLFCDAPMGFDVLSVFDHVQVAGADLDGDGHKEIVVVSGGIDRSTYTVAVFQRDGNPWPAWSPIEVSDMELGSLAAADLDGDGSSELLILGNDPTTSFDQIVVFDGTGDIREGWPVRSADGRYSQSRFSVGDLDADGRFEIVWIGEEKISVLRHDGSPWCEPWSNGGNPPYNRMSPPLVADIDGDGEQEIVAVVSSVNFDRWDEPYCFTTATVYDRTGATRWEWPLFGQDGQQIAWATPSVGDFDGDGNTDLTVTMALISGGGISGWVLEGAMTCLTTHTPFNAPGSNWISSHSDSQYSRTPHAVPSFTLRPDSRHASAGSSVKLTARVTGYPSPRIQWQKDGVDIPGATGLTLEFPSVQRWHAGRYTLVATSSLGTTSCEAVLSVDDASSAAARALNLSTRALIRGANQPMIPGFVVGGTGSKRLLIRAVGPRLRDFGIADPLEDPRLVLKQLDRATNTYSDLVGNDNWPGDDDTLRAASTAVGAFSLRPASLDAAMLVDVLPGQYTVFAEGAGGSPTGVALVEIYDVDPAGSPATLINVSNRGYVGTGGHVMIPGFVVSNAGSRTFLLRAVGPGLIPHGVQNPLGDPQLSLYRTIDGTSDSELILTNDNWSEHPDAATTSALAKVVSAFGLAAGSKDAALVATLRPGSYTIHASGVSGATGETLVELYLVPVD